MSGKLIKSLTIGLMSGILSLSSSLSAFFFNNNDCCYSNDCCYQENYCCEDGPLRCGAFNIQAKGGGAPSHFTHRGHTYIVNPAVFPPFFEGNRIGRFKDHFNTPWTVGAELSWNASTHVQFFAEYAYHQASGKRHNFTAGGFEFNQRHDNYSNNAFYLGTNYYFQNVWCDNCWGSIAPFIGFKGGFVWQNHSRAEFLFGGDSSGSFSASDSRTHDYYKNQWVPSAGARIGFDWSFNCNWGFIFTAEAVVTQGLKTNHNVVTGGNAPGAATNVILGHTGKIVSFPITAGIRYTF